MLTKTQEREYALRKQLEKELYQLLAKYYNLGHFHIGECTGDVMELIERVLGPVKQRKRYK